MEVLWKYSSIHTPNENFSSVELPVKRCWKLSGDLTSGWRPHQRVEGHSGRWIYQSRIQDLNETGETLLRVVVEEAEGKILILTIYSTSQVDRYWQGATPR